jgi:glycine/D-amino acid oxidase-like deaminating enzyme
MKKTPLCVDFDTVVVGGGIVGLFASWFLAEEGAAVLCLNDGRNAGSFANAGSLHGQMQSRMERLFPERVADYQETLGIYPRAIDYWADIAKRLDEDIEYQLGGGLMIAETPQHLDSLRAKSAVENRCGIESSILGASEVLSMAPYLRDGVVGALYCPKEGKVNPLTATSAVRRIAIAKGTHIIDGARVTRCEAESASYRVHSSMGEFQVARVLIAAGAGSGELAATLGVDIPVSAEPLHMNITEPTRPFLPHLVQHAELALTMKQLKTGQLLIGGGWPAQFSKEQPGPTVIAESLMGNLALARHLVPGIAGLQVQRSWAGINTMVDLMSVLGEADAAPGVFLAIPGDAGYTLAPYCARLIVDLMSGRSPDFPLEVFSPRRFAS